ncbi:SDR family NAD(P)-dependent oxidoreductase [Bradyrhizobium brasilense]|uniref:SDR family NAD(P)-dependent oxidoreductase n=1 Tax=Bradyrhizobium brasilense TaxID=1419277 RepID=UPI0024BF466D|nr:SDR family NAD(P)-dependent oxidoreductase [Bradyrhizobium brasilense]
MSGKSLEGRKALVTGGARGIGAAIAQALARSGAAVMIGDILDDAGEGSAAEIAKAGVKTGFVKLDVTDDGQWERAAAATVETLGGFDILINNAGIEITSLVADIKAEDARRMCDVNIVGTVLGMKHAFRAMRPGAPRARAARSSISLRSRRRSPSRASRSIPAPNPRSTA